MTNLSCQEFCDNFNVFIGFDQSGYGQIFATKPKFIERDNFFLSSDDSKLLPCLVNDYFLWSNKRKVILFSPGEKAPDINNKLGAIMACDDFKKDDQYIGNVTITDIISDGAKSTVVCTDGSHDFVWSTKSKALPLVQEKKFLKAKITGNCVSVNVDIPAFEVTGCSFLKEKK